MKKFPVIASLCLGFLCAIGFLDACTPQTQHECTVGEWVVADEATCAKTGTLQLVCKDCGAVMDEKIIEQTDHAIVYVSAKEATCTESGCVEHWECETCGACFLDAEGLQPISESEVHIPAAHSCSHMEAKAASCEEKGNIEYWTCTRCGKEFKDSSFVYTVSEIEKWIPSLGHSFENGACVLCGAKEESAYVRNEDMVLIGFYPQTMVEDDNLVQTLNALAGDLPTQGVSTLGNWISYEYYLDSQIVHYMWYRDLEYEGETYRGVYFLSYRPYDISGKSNSSWTYQADNGYELKTIYWFKWEPIQWHILSETDTQILLMCDSIIDSREYNSVAYNLYNISSIRNWLINVFYEEAFTTAQRGIIAVTDVDNSASTTGYSKNSNTCDDTQDKVFLLSYEEVVNNAYGFSENYLLSDPLCQATVTDYAKAQGAYVIPDGEYKGNGLWWLRSPYYLRSDEARIVYASGYTGEHNDIKDTYVGVRPAIWINK